MGFDIIDILSKLNKAALFFFIATVVFLVYEFYLFRKERSKKSKLKVPQFDNVQTATMPPVVQKAAPTPQFPPMQKKKRRKSKAVVIAAVSVLALGLVGILVFRLNSVTRQDASVAPFQPNANEPAETTDLTGSEQSTSSARTGTVTESATETATSSPDLVAATISSAPTPSAATAAPTSVPVASGSSMLASAASPSPTKTPVKTATPTPAEDESTASADIASESARPTGVSELPLTADSNSAPYTMFIFLAAIITFFVAFLY